MNEHINEQRMADFIIGESAAIQHVRTLITKLAPTTLPILIQGPTGSGKELVAQAIHELGGRSGPLVAVNVCAISDTMFEDALFGHTRGAFSGAVGEKIGYLTEADHGSIFLDEIGALPLATQAKLLRAIETGQFRPVGAPHDHQSDFRVIAAANEDLRALVAEGRFRADLLHRLGGAVIQLPGLERRVDDIGLLAQHFAASASAIGTHTRLSDSAIRLLQRRAWPGNVRELKHVVEYAAAWATTPVVGRHDIDAVETFVGAAPVGVDTDAEERRRLISVLEKHDWRVGRAAHELGVHRTTLSNWMRRLGVPRPSSTRRRTILGDDGLVLLEVIVALIILALAGLSAVASVAQAMHTASHAHAVASEIRDASAYMDVVALWTRADLDRHLGSRHEGRWLVRIDRTTSALYGVTIADSANHRVLLGTTLFRPDSANGHPQ